MNFDAIAYLRERNIEFITGGKNVSPGWINISCPFCNSSHSPDPSFHGGFSPEGKFSCWRCGGHSIENTIMCFDKVQYHNACKIRIQYQTNFRPSMPARPKASGKFQLPLGTKAMTPRHKEYLRRRQFDPDLLEAKYNLLGTGPAGHCPHRIVVPVFHQSRMVSWQARDITGRAELRYKSCSPDMEEVCHKDILYNIDNCRGQSIIVMEGITDVWRLGDDCCCTFGTKVTQAQILAISKFSGVFLLFDGEPQAQRLAQKIASSLSGLGVLTENVLLNDGDPGSMSQSDANRLKSELLGE